MFFNCVMVANNEQKKKESERVRLFQLFIAFWETRWVCIANNVCAVQIENNHDALGFSASKCHAFSLHSTTTYIHFFCRARFLSLSCQTYVYNSFAYVKFMNKFLMNVFSSLFPFHLSVYFFLLRPYDEIHIHTHTQMEMNE